MVGRHLVRDAAEHLLQHLVPGRAADLRGSELLEVAEHARQQLQVGSARQLLAALRGEEQQRRPADTVPLLPHVDQAVGAQPVQVAAHRLLAQVKRLRKLRDRRLATAAH